MTKERFFEITREEGLSDQIAVDLWNETQNKKSNLPPSENEICLRQAIRLARDIFNI